MHGAFVLSKYKDTKRMSQMFPVKQDNNKKNPPTCNINEASTRIPKPHQILMVEKSHAQILTFLYAKNSRLKF